MQTRHVSSEVVHGGRVVVADLPFREGQRVEVAISEVASNKQSIEEVRKVLRGSVERYDNPFEPVIAADDWEMLR